MRTLILGGAGFVGHYLMQALLDAGREVFATKLPHECIDAPVTVYDLDLCNREEVDNLLRTVQPQVIYHLAAQSSVKLSWENPALTTQVNALGAVNLFEGIRTVCPEAKTVIIGSSEEYGSVDYTNDVSEEVAPSPNNVYALTKLFQEQLAKIYGKAYGLHLVMTRSFNHFGPRQPRQFVVSDFCHQVAEIEAGKKEPVLRVGNLGAYRDFTDVRDVVRAYLLLAEKGQDGEVYNVGSGNSVRIGELLDIILKNAKREIRVETDPAKFRPTETERIQADIKKISALGWKPQISIVETIKETLESCRKEVRK